MNVDDPSEVVDNQLSSSSDQGEGRAARDARLNNPIFAYSGTPFTNDWCPQSVSRDFHIEKLSFG